MDTPYVLLAAFLGLLWAAWIIDQKVRTKTPLDKFFREIPEFSAEGMWRVEGVRDVPAFVNLILNHSEVGDHFIIDRFQENAPPGMWLENQDICFHGDLMVKLDNLGQRTLDPILDRLFARPVPVFAGLRVVSNRRWLVDGDPSWCGVERMDFWVSGTVSRRTMDEAQGNGVFESYYPHEEFQGDGFRFGGSRGK